MTPGLRVAHVGRFRKDTSNGVDKTVAGLVGNLAAAGVDPELWTFTASVAAVEEVVEAGVRTFLIPWPSSRMRSITVPPRVAVDFVSTRSAHVDVLHLHSVYVPANYWCARSGLPAVLTPNGGMHPSVDRVNALAKAAARMTWEGSVRRHASVLHAVSESEAELLRQRQRQRLRQRRIVVIPNGIDDDDLMYRAAPVPSTGPLLFLGRLAIEHKGLDLLLEGYALALAGGPLPPLLLAGPGADRDRERLLYQAARLGISGRVSLIGTVQGKEKDALLRRASLFVHTSRWDGLPFSVLEALAAGRPVLVTPGTNAAEYVGRAAAGEVVEADAASIASGLRRACSWSADQRADRAAAARSLVETQFRWSVLARQMVETYRSVLALAPS